IVWRSTCRSTSPSTSGGETGHGSTETRKGTVTEARNTYEPPRHRVTEIALIRAPGQSRVNPALVEERCTRTRGKRTSDQRDFSVPPCLCGPYVSVVY